MNRTTKIIAWVVSTLLGVAAVGLMQQAAKKSATGQGKSLAQLQMNDNARKTAEGVVRENLNSPQ